MLVVSLTTTRKRSTGLPRVIESLARQTVLPDRIVIAISREPFLVDEGFGHAGVADLAAEMSGHHRILRRLGCELDLYLVPNYGPLRKLLTALSEARYDDVLVTCDDDCIYPSDWVASLLEADNRRDVICGRARRILPDRPYKQWPQIRRPCGPAADLLPVGRDGILYRRRYLEDKVFDWATAMQLCPAQDDLWIRAHYAPGVRVRVAPSLSAGQSAGGEIEPLPPIDPLWHTNVNEGGNDAALEKLRSAGIKIADCDRR